jgi:hypothetical protein
MRTDIVSFCVGAALVAALGVTGAAGATDGAPAASKDDAATAPRASSRYLLRIGGMT